MCLGMLKEQCRAISIRLDDPGGLARALEAAAKDNWLRQLVSQPYEAATDAMEKYNNRKLEELSAESATWAIWRSS
jgi:hypothetical protein